MISKTARKFSPLQLIKRDWNRDISPDFTRRHFRELNELDVLDNSQDELGEEESKKQARPLTDHERALLPAIQRGRKGAAYCCDADAAGAQPPRGRAWRVKAMQERKGPDGEIPATASSVGGPYYFSYTAAYRNPRMRRLIQDEKCRIRKKAVALGLLETTSREKTHG